MISTRHIRHDWRTFVDSHDQHSVMTMCGKKSKPHLSGIPGLTLQDGIVQKNGKAVWGWCVPCINGTGREINRLIESGVVSAETTSSEVLEMYRRANEVVHPMRVRVSEISYRWAKQNNPDTKVRPITSAPVI